MNICGNVLALGVELMRESKSGNIFLSPAICAEVTPKGLLSVKFTNTSESALLLIFADAAFFVHDTAVVLSASICTTGFGCADVIKPSVRAWLVAA